MLILLVGAGCSALLAKHAVNWTKPVPSESRPLVIDSSQLDFGEAWECEKHVIRLDVANRSKEAVHIPE